VPTYDFESSPMKTYSQSQMMSSRDRANSFHDIRDRDAEHSAPVAKQRTRHSTLPYGVGSADLTAAKFDMDMKNIIRELEDTGFFHQNDVSSYSAAQSRCVTPAPSVKDAGRDSWVKKKTNLSSQSDVDYKKLALVNDDLLKMWEESQAENTKLRLELSGVRSDLETARHQLDSAEKKVVKNNAVTDQEKREKKIVVKKLAEMEEELKLLALSENLTDQTLDQLKSDNTRLRDENTALLRVIAKMSK